MFKQKWVLPKINIGWKDIVEILVMYSSAIVSSIYGQKNKWFSKALVASFGPSFELIIAIFCNGKYLAGSPLACIYYTQSSCQNSVENGWQSVMDKGVDIISILAANLMATSNIYFRITRKKNLHPWCRIGAGWGSPVGVEQVKEFPRGFPAGSACNRVRNLESSVDEAFTYVIIPVTIIMYYSHPAFHKSSENKPTLPWLYMSMNRSNFANCEIKLVLVFFHVSFTSKKWVNVHPCTSSELTGDSQRDWDFLLTYSWSNLLSFGLFPSLLFFDQFDIGERLWYLNTSLSDVRLRFMVERSMKRSTRKQCQMWETYLSRLHVLPRRGCLFLNVTSRLTFV